MRWGSLLVVLSLVVACAPAPKPRTFVDTIEFNAPFDRVWEAVIETFKERDWLVAEMKESAGLVATDWIKTEDMSLFDCGDAGLSYIFIKPLLRINVSVERKSNELQSVRVACSFMASRQYLLDYSLSPTKHECPSTGKLEQRILFSIRQKLSR